MWIADAVIAVCVLTGALLMVSSALAMFRAKDALSRINVFSPATGLGMPLVVAGCYIHTLQQEGFSLYRLLIAIVAFLSLIIVSSIASNTLSRSTVLAGSPVHRYTRPNRLVAPLRLADDGEEPQEAAGSRENGQTSASQESDPQS